MIAISLKRMCYHGYLYRKDASINEEVEKLRHAATSQLLSVVM